MSGNIEDFTSLQPRNGTITVAGGTRLAINGVGDVTIRTVMPDNTTRTATITDVIYSRALNATRLFSWSQIRHRYKMTAKGNDLFLIKDGVYAMWAHYNSETLSMTIQLDRTNAGGNATAHFASYREFHKSIGHAYVPNPSLVYDDDDILAKPKDWHCDDCAVAKSTHTVPPPASRDNAQPFKVMHTDLSGKFSVQSIGRSWYFMPIVDEATRFA